MRSGETESERLRATERFYDRVSGVYDALADASEHDARRCALELLGAAPGERLLEVGFGTGHALEALAESAGPSGRVVGIDISTRMRDEASHRLDASGLSERVELEVHAVPPIPHADDSFDGAFAAFTIELFPSAVRQRLLEELRRVLTPSGRLSVASMATTPPERHETMMTRAYRFMHRHFPHIVDCEAIDVDDVVSRAGFRIERREALEIWGLPVVAAIARPC